MKYIDTIVDNLHVYIYIKIDKKGKEKIMRLSLIYYQRLYNFFLYMYNFFFLGTGIHWLMGLKFTEVLIWKIKKDGRFIMKRRERIL